jgi:hypothetical protein
MEGVTFAQGIETEDKFEAHLEEMLRLEEDAESVIYKFPDYWIVAV